MLDTSDSSTITLRKFDAAFGFSPGERWFGYVSCDELLSNERVRSGIFEGELVLISKRTLPTRKVRVDSQIQEITLLDVNGDGTNMTLTIPYKVRGDRGDSIFVCQIHRLRIAANHEQATLWIAVKALAWKVCAKE